MRGLNSFRNRLNKVDTNIMLLDPDRIDRVENEYASCYASLKEFTKQAWAEVVKSEPFMDNWHIDAIAEHLTACYTRDIRNLVINMPPRHGKSLFTSVFFPVWVWINTPSERFLYTTHSLELTVRDSLACRRLIMSPWFQNAFGHRFLLSRDQRGKLRFDNNRGGYRIASSVSAGVTGDGGDFVCVDDPHDAGDIHSPVKRAAVTLWWDETMSTRVNNPNTAVRIINMQRLDERDLSGHVLHKGNYEYLCLPAEYEGSKYVTSIGWSDPRTEENELLFPERYPREIIDELKQELGSHATAGQLQQRPTPRGGGIIKRDWFMWYQEEPQFTNIIQSWDTAFKTGQNNDYSVCTTWGMTDKDYYLIDCYKKKLEFPDLLAMSKNLYNEYSPVWVIIEDKASGQSLIQSLKRESKLPIKLVKVDTDKESRLHAVSPLIESGRVFLPEGAKWTKDYISNMTGFPAAPHDDDVDSTTQALNFMAAINRNIGKRYHGSHFHR